MPLFYRAYGLHLEANQLIPGLQPLTTAAQPPDLRIWLQHLPQAWAFTLRPDETAEQVLRLQTYQHGSYWQVVYRDGAEFVIDYPGNQIWIDWPETSTLEDVATYLLGPILGFVLRLRGVLCLHASAIAVAGRAIALVGVSGAGKSTTAAALAQRGYPVLSDDVLALTTRADTWWVQPAYPQLRLWSTAVNVLYGHPEALPCLTPTWEKRYLDLQQPGYRFQAEPLPLAAIYLLQPRCTTATAPWVEVAPGTSALLALITNTYANTLLDKPMRAEEFQTLGQLAEQTPIFRVFPHTDPQRLPQLSDAILASLALQ